RIDPAGEHVAVERAQEAADRSGTLRREVLAGAEHERLQLLVRRSALQKGDAGRDLTRAWGTAQERPVGRAGERGAILVAGQECVGDLRASAAGAEEGAEGRELCGPDRAAEQVEIGLREEALIRRRGARVGRDRAAERLALDG